MEINKSSLKPSAFPCNCVPEFGGSGLEVGGEGRGGEEDSATSSLDAAFTSRVNVALPEARRRRGREHIPTN